MSRPKYTASDTKSKNFRRQVLARDRAKGLTHCPMCGVEIDYENGRAPNGAQADHIVAVANGGSFHVDNGQTICARCNSSKGAYDAPKHLREQVESHTPEIWGLIDW